MLTRNKGLSTGRRSTQQGSSLIEGLVAILLFSVGMIGLLGLQAVAIKYSTDAKSRADAAYYANQIIANMWVDRANLDSYAHYNGGALCSPSGSASTLANVTTWISEVSASLPNAVANRQQIRVSTPTPGTRQVTVTLCWRGPQESAYHNHVATAQIPL